MAIEQAVRFILRVSEEAALRERVHDASAPDIVRIAAADGFSFTEAELSEVLASDSRELNDDELAHASGGTTTGDVNTLVQYVLKESYLQNTEDLRHYAEKVKYFNKTKAALRDYLSS